MVMFYNSMQQTSRTSSVNLKAVAVHSIGRGVPIDKSLLYLPTTEDMRVICLEHFTQRKNFFDDIPQFHLQEAKAEIQVTNLRFNVEFANITGDEINLSKSQKAELKQLKQGAGEMSILDPDLRIKIQGDLARKPIGFVMRGGFSQARGQGMGLGVIDQSEIAQLIAMNKAGVSAQVQKQVGKIALYRKPSSLVYQPCWLLN